MRIKTYRKVLAFYLDAMATLAKHCDNTFPPHIHLKATEEGRWLQITNGNDYLSVKLRGETHIPGEALVDAVALKKTIDTCEENVLILHLNGESSELCVEDSHITVRIGCEEEFNSFPPMISLEDEEGVRGTDLLDAVLFTKDVMAPDPSHPNFNGLHFCPETFEDGTFLRVVATDGHRLARRRVPFYGGIGFDFVAPSTLIGVLEKLLKGCEEEVRIGSPESTTLIIFQTDDWILSTHDQKHTFPNISSFDPHGSVGAIFDPKKATDRTQRIIQTTGKGITMSWDLREGKIYIRTAPNDKKIQADSSFKTEHGEGLVSFKANSTYLLDALTKLKGKRTGVFQKDDLSPIFFFPERESRETLYVIMPIRS